MLETRARLQPETTAFHFEGRETTFSELWRGVCLSAERLRQQGIRRGDRVVIVLPNGPEFFVTFYGVLRAGGIAVPVFPGSGVERLVSLVGLCGVRWLVGASEQPEQVGQRLVLTGCRLLTAGDLASPGFDGPDSDEVVVGDSSVDQTNDAPFPPVLQPDDLAYIQYTSGSTGDPKGVELTHAMVLANLEQLIAGMGITRREVFVSWLPVHHDMGLVLKTMVPFYLAAKLILLPASLTHVRRWLEAIEHHRGTFTAAPDFAYRLCLRRIRDPKAIDLSSLRVALNAAEPVRAQTLVEFESAFGLQQVMVPGYGLAEATVGVSMATPGQPVKVDARGFVSVGRPFPEIELAILRGEERVGAGDVGEIVLRSPANTRGYYRNSKATEKLFWRQFLRTGDLGYLDAEGELFIVGREKNIIIHGGRNVAPREVEEIVDRLLTVRRVAAVGVDRGRVEGEQVFVFAEIRPKDAACEADLQALVIAMVGEIHRELGFRPGRVYLLKPRAVPLTHNGKVRHRELRARYLDGRLRGQGQILFPDY